jgi:uncharacterized protein (DUF362 family)
MPDFQAHLAKLATQIHADGGWGYATGQSAYLEPTCLGLLALNLDAKTYCSQIERSESAIERCLTNGVYRDTRSRDESLWPTALVLFVKAIRCRPAAELQKLGGRLLALHGQRADDKQAREVHDIDLTLIGWPWASSNFSWVEPTAWSCIALKAAGYGSHPRVVEGLRLLIDRAFDDGGANYGNRQILGKRTDPIPGPTALMLIAWQGQEPHPRIDASIDYLLRQPEKSDDLEHLCWNKLALGCYSARPEVAAVLANLDQRIEQAYEDRQQTNWAPQGTPRREAMAALALASLQDNPFRLEKKSSGSSTSVAVSGDDGVPRPSWGQRFGAKFRGLAVEAVGRLRQAASRSAVHIARAADYNADLLDLLSRQYDAFRDQVPLSGKRVVLKPNLVEYHRDKVINTHPNVVAATIELCKREKAAEILVAEGPGHWRNVEYLVRESGLGDVLRHHGVPFIDLNHDEPVKLPNFGRLTGLEYLFISKTIATADVVISLPKLKTHHWAGATLSLKNMFGSLPGICYGWPKNELHWRGIDNSIVDIALTRTPDLAIVDGIVGMEGDGPLNGTPKPFGAIIMGNDLAAVDATCCRLMELDPERIKYLYLAGQKRLGRILETEIEQLGERIAALAQPFTTVPHFNEIRRARSA